MAGKVPARFLLRVSSNVGNRSVRVLGFLAILLVRLWRDTLRPSSPAGQTPSRHLMQPDSLSRRVLHCTGSVIWPVQ